MSDKFFSMLSKLLAKTKSGQASWVSGSRIETFIWSGTSASVAVLTKDNDGQAPYTVRLLNDEGQTIEEETLSWQEDGFELFEDLYHAARADALDINSALDSILEDLEDPF